MLSSELRQKINNIANRLINRWLQVRHKPTCAATEARKRLEISGIETRGIIQSRQRQQKR